MVIICFFLWLFSPSLPPSPPCFLVYFVGFFFSYFIFIQAAKSIHSQAHQGSSRCPRRRADPTLRCVFSFSGRLPHRCALGFGFFFLICFLNFGVIFLSFSSSFRFVWGFSAVPGLSCQVQSKGANFSLNIPPLPSLFCCSVVLLFSVSSVQGPSGVAEVFSPAGFLSWCGFFFNYLLFLVPQHPSPGPPGATASKDATRLDLF